MSVIEVTQILHSSSSSFTESALTTFLREVDARFRAPDKPVFPLSFAFFFLSAAFFYVAF
jgi:hypothetical protein